MHYTSYKNLRYRPRENHKRRTMKDLRLNRLHHGYYNWVPYNFYGNSDGFREKTWYILWYRFAVSSATKQHKKWDIVFDRFQSTSSRIAKKLHRFKK